MPASPYDPFTIHQGDARQLGHLLDRVAEPNKQLVTCTITSPPYGALKDYGHPDQIGWGQPHDEYLAEMRRVFRAIYHRTRVEGSMWIIADSFRGDDQRKFDIPQRMEPLPFQLAEQAADAGWILRENIIWQKQKTLPWSSGRRLRNVFEHVLLFVKSSSYKFHSDRLRDPDNLEEWWVKWPERYNPNGKVPTNVWEIPIPQQGTWAGTAVQHACPLPPDLVERLIFLSTDEGDVVFDPFAGTGVVVAEAQRLGRRGIGIELNKKYVQAFSKSILPEIDERSHRDLVRERSDRASELRTRIINLRAMKYPKVLWQRLSNENKLPLPQLVVQLKSKTTPQTMTDSARPLAVTTIFVYPDHDKGRLDDVRLRLKEIANQPPATKFGIVSEIVVTPIEDLSLWLKRGKLFLYDRGRTWDAVRQVRPNELASLTAPSAVRTGSYAYPPIVGNVELHETPGQRP